MRSQSNGSEGLRGQQGETAFCFPARGLVLKGRRILPSDPASPGQGSLGLSATPPSTIPHRLCVP